MSRRVKVTKRRSSLHEDATVVEVSAPGGAEPGCLVSFGYVDGKLLIDVYRVSGVVKVRTGDARFAVHQKPGVECAVIIDATKKEEAMDVLKQVEIDIAAEEGYAEETTAWAAKYGCRAELLQENGPAGGNPLYRVIGKEEALRELLLDYCGQSWPQLRGKELARQAKADFEELYATAIEPYAGATS